MLSIENEKKKVFLTEIDCRFEFHLIPSVIFHRFKIFSSETICLTTTRKMVSVK